MGQSKAFGTKRVLEIDRSSEWIQIKKAETLAAELKENHNFNFHFFWELNAAATLDAELPRIDFPGF